MQSPLRDFLGLALPRHAFGVAQVAEGEASLPLRRLCRVRSAFCRKALSRHAFRVGDGAGLVVFGNRFEVAHGDRRGGGGE